LSKPRKIVLAVAAATLVIAAFVATLVLGLAKDASRDFRLVAQVPAPSGEPLALALFQSLGVRMLPGHEVALLENGAVFDALVHESEQATKSIHVVMYIWESGQASERFSKALIASAKRGAACRILVDDVGSPDFKRTVALPLEDAGCEVRVFRPKPAVDELARNHRKIVVFDGRVAITGGFGVRDNWLGDGVHGGSWRDTSVRFSGPSVLDAQQAFAENWQEAGGALLPADAFPVADTSGPSIAAFLTSTGSPVLTRAERWTQLLSAGARKRLWIANAYFVPSQGILDVLSARATRGVDVRILVPGKQSDSKTSFGAQQIEYGDLLERGVRIWEYSTVMMHSKTMLVDDAISVIGSTNLEPLSLNKLEEASLIVEDAALAGRLSESFRADCARAVELKRE
jgi:cardiolipin synthase A/B